MVFRSSALVVALTLCAAAPSLAQDDKKSPPAGASEGDVLDDKAIDDATASLPDEEVKVGGTKLGESVGGATGFVFKQGFYTQSDLGGFFTLGAALGANTGYSISRDAAQCPRGAPCVPVSTSNLQPYIGLSLGYDISQYFGIQASFGTGFVENAALYSQSEKNPRDYGFTMANLAAVGSFYVLERLAISVKLAGGLAFVTPEPEPGEPTVGGNVGFGIGVRYATLLPDVFVGIDGNVLAGIIPTSNASPLIIPAISFAPVIKYVF
jgi:hypothetical protein